MSNLKQDSLDYHAQGRPGKLKITATKPMNTQRDLALAYSPGVAYPVLAIAEDGELAYKYTAKGNLVAVISNGTATCAIGPNGAPRCEVATCDPGYFRASATSCAPVVDATCSVCATDADCRTPGDRCLTLGSERVCGRDCSAGNLHGTPENECYAGFACEVIAGGPKQCVPTSDTCSCLPANRGATMALHSTVGFSLSALGAWAVGVALDAAGGPASASAWTAAFAVLALGILLGPLALHWSRAASAPRSS